MTAPNEICFSLNEILNIDNINNILRAGLLRIFLPMVFKEISLYQSLYGHTSFGGSMFITY